MNPTIFIPKSIENLGINNSSVNIRFVVKTSDIRNISQNIRSDDEVATLAALSPSVVRILKFHNLICSEKFQ